MDMVELKESFKGLDQQAIKLPETGIYYINMSLL